MSANPPEPELRSRALAALHDVIDPELALDVVDLGLVYRLEVRGGTVELDLTMTSPACPLGDQIVHDAEERLGALDGVDAVDVRLVWDPPWSPERMSPAARRAMGWGD